MLAHGLCLLRRMRRAAPTGVAERARHARLSALHRLRITRGYDHLRRMEGVTEHLDPNEAPRIGRFCPTCGGERRWGVTSARRADERVCALTRPCMSRLQQEATLLTGWWQHHQAASAKLEVETGETVVWIWDDATRRWVRR